MSPGRPEMVLFDYGGTLLCEPERDALRGERAVLAHAVSNPLQLSPEALSAWEQEHIRSRWFLRDLDVEPPAVQLLRLKYELHGITLDIPYEEAEYVLWSGASPLSERCVYPHVREMLEALHAGGIRTGVISNLVWSGKSLKRRIDALLPGNHFEFVITSSDYGIRKPDGRLFRLALARAGLGPEKAWYCGNDRRKDVEGSRAEGLTPVLYLGHMEGDGKDASEALPEDGDTAAITDWNQLPELLGLGR